MYFLPDIHVILELNEQIRLTINDFFSPNADMLNTTKTGLGKALLKRWLLQPSTEAEVINDRLNAVECFSRSENGKLYLPSSLCAVEPEFERLKWLL